MAEHPNTFYVAFSPTGMPRHRREGRTLGTATERGSASTLGVEKAIVDSEHGNASVVFTFEPVDGIWSSTPSAYLTPIDIWHMREDVLVHFFLFWACWWSESFRSSCFRVSLWWRVYSLFAESGIVERGLELFERLLRVINGCVGFGIFSFGLLLLSLPSFFVAIDLALCFTFLSLPPLRCPPYLIEYHSYCGLRETCVCAGHIPCLPKSELSSALGGRTFNLMY